MKFIERLKDNMKHYGMEFVNQDGYIMHPFEGKIEHKDIQLSNYKGCLLIDERGRGYAIISEIGGIAQDYKFTIDVDSTDDIKETKGFIKNISTDKYPNIRDCQGNTPLHISVLKGDIETTKALFGMGAKANIMNEQGITPADLANSVERNNPSTVAISQLIASHNKEQIIKSSIFSFVGIGRNQQQNTHQM